MIGPTTIQSAAELKAHLRQRKGKYVHVIIRLMDLNQLEQIGALLAGHSGLIGLDLRGARFVNLYRNQLLCYCERPELKLYFINLSITDLLSPTVTILLNRVPIENVIELNLAGTHITFSALDSLSNKYLQNQLLNKQNHLRRLNVGLTDIGDESLPILQNIISMNRELRQLNLEHIAVRPQLLAKLIYQNNAHLESINYANVMDCDDALTPAEAELLGKQLGQLPKLRSMTLSGIRFNARSFRAFTDNFQNSTLNLVELRTCGLEDHDWQSLEQFLSRNAVRQIDLTGNAFTPERRERLCELCQQVESVIKIDQLSASPYCNFAAQYMTEMTATWDFQLNKELTVTDVNVAAHDFAVPTVQQSNILNAFNIHRFNEADVSVFTRATVISGADFQTFFDSNKMADVIDVQECVEASDRAELNEYELASRTELYVSGLSGSEQTDIDSQTSDRVSDQTGTQSLMHALDKALGQQNACDLTTTFADLTQKWDNKSQQLVKMPIQNLLLEAQKQLGNAKKKDVLLQMAQKMDNLVSVQDSFYLPLKSVPFEYIKTLAAHCTVSPQRVPELHELFDKGLAFPVKCVPVSSDSSNENALFAIFQKEVVLLFEDGRKLDITHCQLISLGQNSVLGQAEQTPDIIFSFSSENDYTRAQYAASAFSVIRLELLKRKLTWTPNPLSALQIDRYI